MSVFPAIMVMFSILFLGVGGFLALKRAPSSRDSVAAIAALSIGYVLMYLTVSPQVAQDRAAYYGYYHAADWEWLWRHIAWSHNLIFDDLLSVVHYLILPDGMSFMWFSAVFMASVVLLYLGVLLLVARHGFLQLKLIPLVLLCVFCDRLFVDAIFNATRGTLSASMFIIGLFTGGWPLLLPALLASFGFHGKMFLMTAAAALLSLLVRIRRQWLLSFFLIAVTVFLLRLVYPYPITALLALFGLQPETVGAYPYDNIFEGVHQGFPLSFSMLVQILLAILVPVTLIAGGMRSVILNEKSGEVAGKSIASPRCMFDIVLVVTGCALLFFPEFGLAQRLFVFPMMLLPLFLSEQGLRVLLLVKVPVFAAVMLGTHWHTLIPR